MKKKMSHEEMVAKFSSALSDLTSASGTFNNATAILTTAATSFSGIAKSIESKCSTRFKELAEWEESLNERKKIMDEMYAVREEVLRKEKDEMEKRMKELKEKEEIWKERQVQMEANATAVDDAVNLNVGGQKFTTTKAILTKHQDSYFSDLFKSKHAKLKEKFFVDRDSRYFGTLLNYLRDGTIGREMTRNAQDMREEFAFYRVPFPDLNAALQVSSDTTTSPPSPQTLPTQEKADTLALQTIDATEELQPNPMFDEADLLSKKKNVVQSWLPDQHLVLLYKATQDGFGAEEYHKRTDDKGPLLITIQSSEGCTFGGYINISNLALHHTSFLFTVANPNKIPPTMYPLTAGNWTVSSNNTKQHIRIGKDKALDIELSPTPNKDQLSRIRFPTAFSDTTGKGVLTFTGSEFFTVREVEVYAVLPMRSKWFYGQLEALMVPPDLRKPIQVWLPNKRFILTYTASQKDFKLSDVLRVSHHHPSLIICRSTKGYLFGAYSCNPSLTSFQKYQHHSTDFVFTLINPHSIPPTKYSPTPQPDHFSKEFVKLATMEHVDYCVGGMDIVLEELYADDGITTCYFHFPYIFADSTGKGTQTFTGSQRTKLRNIEFYRVV